MTLTEDEALHVSLLPRPDAALRYLADLEEGDRPSVAQRKNNIRSSEVEEWRAASSLFDAMCAEAEVRGTGTIDDLGLSHCKVGTPGWASVWKTLQQRRDPAYADRSQVEKNENVSIVSYKEAEPDDWENEAKAGGV